MLSWKDSQRLNEHRTVFALELVSLGLRHSCVTVHSSPILWIVVNIVTGPLSIHNMAKHFLLPFLTMYSNPNVGILICQVLTLQET